MFVIGITGHPSAGKDTAAVFFVKNGYVHISTGDILRDEMKKSGIPLDRPHMSEFAAKIKKEHGFGYLAELASEKIVKNTVVSGIRAPLEVEILRKKFGGKFKLIVINAKIETRYNRAKLRNRPGDNASFEKFKEIEEKERNSPTGAQQVDKVIELADIHIDNEGSFETLYRQLEQFV